VQDPAESRALREELIRTLQRDADVRTQAVRDAMLAIPRHRFVSERASLRACYENRPLPIGYGQTISQPAIVALMTEALDLRGAERVLEIGTGSGYQAAVLAHVLSPGGGEVFTVEIIPELADRARALLDDLGYRNVHLRVGDGRRGWVEEAPFDRIVTTAGSPRIPGALFDQLVDGGILVGPVGLPHAQDLLRYHKMQGRLVVEDLGPVAFVPMTRPGDAPDPW
jgi:protein-L-isoaspartate(D-aspartate) O-methyltransferase